MAGKGSRQPTKRSRRQFSHYWLAIIKSPEDLESYLADPWWCLPSEVEVGHKLLLYRPQSAAAKDEIRGIFAATIVVRVGPETIEERMKCAGSVTTASWQVVTQTYCRLAPATAFRRPLLLADMKKDDLFSQQSFVRRNFQGAVFAISRLVFERAVELGSSSKK
jgi:hypothetical protein